MEVGPVNASAANSGTLCGPAKGGFELISNPAATTGGRKESALIFRVSEEDTRKIKARAMLLNLSQNLTLINDLFP
jgi:hypothetical protein